MHARVIGYNSEKGQPRDHSTKVWSQLAKYYQRRRFEKKIHRSYLKTMSADGGHLGCTSWSSDTIMKGERGPPKDNPTKVWSQWPSSFRGEDF